MLKMTNFVFTSYLLTHSYNPHEIHRELNLGLRVNGEAKQCCTEDITQDCENMDTSCHWECRTTTTSSYPHNVTTITTSSNPETTTRKDTNDEKFCIGGTDMYMQGFSVSLYLHQKTIK